MRAKSFVMTGVDIFDKKEIINLPSNDERYLYIVLRGNPFSNYIGLYPLRFNILSQYCFIPTNKIVSALESLRDASLIDFDDDTEHIRICNWFDKTNRAPNISAMKRYINDFGSIQTSKELLIPSGVEFLYAMENVHRTWKDSKMAYKYLDELRTWLMGIDHELFETEFNTEMTKNGPHLKQIIINEREDNKIETPSRDSVDIQDNTRQYQNYIK